MVLNTAVKLARFASIMMPSKDNTGMLGETYRAAAALIGLPESKEQNIKNLSGPIADALGIPPNKTWDELSVIEKKEVERRSKSVIDAIEKFDRGAIERLRQSMALTDEMQKAHPVQEFAGEEVDGEIIKQLEGTRIDHDMTGEKMGGKTINRATAFILALRQRRDDWGDPEKRTGYMGQYRMFIDRLESNIQHHIDLGGAMFQMQRAWNEYAFGMLKLAGGTALALWIIALLGGSAAVIGIQTMKVVGRAGMNTLRSLRGGARTIGQTVRNLPETPGVINRTKDMLTKMRYLESERRLAKALESTKLGKTLARLKTLQNTRIAKIGGAVLKYASWGAVPAITFYQLYAQNQRRAGVTQEELKAEYANQMGITALEGTGLGATLFLGTGAGIVLAAPVIYAGDFALKRSEVRADWKRDVASYMKEYDSAGLRAKIEQTTSSAAVEAGGGGALRPRIMMPSKADIEAASVAIEQGVAGARQSAYEAYFWQNLLVSPGTNEQMQKKIVNDKMTYLRSATSDDYDDAYNTVLDRADIYADLIQRREMLIRSGEPPLLSYEDETGERKFIDLRLLSPSVAKDGPEMRAVVGDYLNHLQPVEEAALFELMGTVALDEKTEAAWEREKAAVRKVLLRKLVHRIHDAEKQIRLIDWPGINVPFVTSGDSYSQDVVRAYLAGKVSEQVDALTTEMMRGEVKPADYPKRMTDIYATLEGILAVTDSPTYLKTAQDYVTAQGIPVNTAENALIKLLTE